jgi:hypothetical protein
VHLSASWVGFFWGNFWPLESILRYHMVNPPTHLSANNPWSAYLTCGGMVGNRAKAITRRAVRQDNPASLAMMRISPQQPRPSWPTYYAPTPGHSLPATQMPLHWVHLPPKLCPAIINCLVAGLACFQPTRECAQELVGVSCTDPSPFIAILLVVLLTLICRIRLISITTLHLIALGPGCGAFSQDQHLHHHKCCRHDY